MTYAVFLWVSPLAESPNRKPTFRKNLLAQPTFPLLTLDRTPAPRSRSSPEIRNSYFGRSWPLLTGQERPQAAKSHSAITHPLRFIHDKELSCGWGVAPPTSPSRRGELHRVDELPQRAASVALFVSFATFC